MAINGADRVPGTIANEILTSGFVRAAFERRSLFLNLGCGSGYPAIGLSEKDRKTACSMSNKLYCSVPI